MIIPTIHTLRCLHRIGKQGRDFESLLYYVIHDIEYSACENMLHSLAVATDGTYNIHQHVERFPRQINLIVLRFSLKNVLFLCLEPNFRIGYRK